VYSFIYITDREVRHEVLIPLATLAALIDIDRKDQSFLEVDEQAGAAEKVKAFFGAGNPVTIDGIEVKPVFDRVDFYGLDLSDFAVRPEKRKVSMASGRVIAYQKVDKTKFSKFLSENVYRWTAPDRPPLPAITELSGTIDWQKYKPTLTVSWATIGLWAVAASLLMCGLFFAKSVWLYLALACAGLIGSYFVSDIAVATYDHPWRQPKQFQISDEEAADVFGRLHANIFRAFDYVDESDQEQGGSVAVIEKVELVDGNLLPVSEARQQSAISFGYKANWTLAGTIEHWGHIHERTNRYQARFLVELLEAENGTGGWKITNIQDQEFKPGVVKQRLRTF